MRTILFLVVLLSACSGPGFKPLPNQAQAVNLVWYEVYGQTLPPPSIEWISQEDLSCEPDAKGVFQGFYAAEVFHGPSNGKCVGGLSWPGLYVVQIAYPDSWRSYTHQDLFAHELWHQALYYTHLDGDRYHTDPGFGRGYGHPYGGAVDQANEALIREGL